EVRSVLAICCNVKNGEAPRIKGIEGPAQDLNQFVFEGKGSNSSCYGFLSFDRDERLVFVSRDLATVEGSAAAEELSHAVEIGLAMLVPGPSTTDRYGASKFAEARLQISMSGVSYAPNTFFISVGERTLRLTTSPGGRLLPGGLTTVSV